MCIRRLVIVALTFVSLTSVACSDEGGTSATGSSNETEAPDLTEPPWGLDLFSLPDDSKAIEATLADFPKELCGLDLSDVSPTHVSYGDGKTFVRAIDLAGAEAEGFPGTAPEYLELLAGSGEVTVEAQVTSPEAGFVYLVSKNTVQDAPDAEPRTTYDAAWGNSEGSWLFAASARSRRQRKALAEVFALAAVGFFSSEPGIFDCA